MGATKMKNVPQSIWLVLGEDTSDVEDFKHLDGEYVLWADSKVFENDIQYVLADSVQDAAYWKERCEAAEEVIDINRFLKDDKEYDDAFDYWQQLKNQNP